MRGDPAIGCGAVWAITPVDAMHKARIAINFFISHLHHRFIQLLRYVVLRFVVGEANSGCPGRARQFQSYVDPCHVSATSSRTMQRVLRSRRFKHGRAFSDIE
jgi:hypothetical protein